jgi:hypothetical protein
MSKTAFTTYVVPQSIGIAGQGDIFLTREGALGDQRQDIRVSPLAYGVLRFNSAGALEVGTADILAVQTLTGAGAVNLTTPTTYLVTTGANALTLANGVPGQRKRIVMITDGGDGTLTPTTKTGFTTITFNDAGDTVELEYINDTIGWRAVFNTGATLA